MPFTVNGFGTSLCGSRGDIGWGSHDGMEWIVAVFMPLIPIKPVHTFGWQGNQYRAIPITWSFNLMARTFFGRWAWGMGFLGALTLLFAVIENVSSNRRSIDFGGILGAVLLFGLATVILIVLRWTDARNKAIRRVLGANTIGNCDPAHLPADVLEKMAGEPRVAHGADTFAEAVRSCLRQRAFARAMWAARVCVVMENRAEGEALTDTILNDPEVGAAVEEVRRDANRWQPLMFVGEAQPIPESTPGPADSLPAEKDDRVRPA